VPELLAVAKVHEKQHCCQKEQEMKSSTDDPQDHAEQPERDHDQSNDEEHGARLTS
jgi:hypothetical protein